MPSPAMAHPSTSSGNPAKSLLAPNCPSQQQQQQQQSHALLKTRTKTFEGSSKTAFCRHYIEEQIVRQALQMVEGYFHPCCAGWKKAQRNKRNCTGPHQTFHLTSPTFSLCKQPNQMPHTCQSCLSTAYNDIHPKYLSSLQHFAAQRLPEPQVVS